MAFVYALAGALPALFLMWWVDRKDSARPEPKALLRRMAILGGLSTLPVIAIEYGLEKVLAIDEHTPMGAITTSFIVAALVEESAKAACLWIGIWHSKAFDERFDGIVYGTRAGLGFALVENIGYLLDSKTGAGFVGIFIMRAVLAVPGHAIWAGFMGYYAAKKKFDDKGPGLFGGLLLAILMHGTYDAALFMCGALPRGWEGLVLILILVPVVVVFGGYRRLKTHAAEAIRLDDLTHVHQGPRLPVGLGFVLR